LIKSNLKPYFFLWQSQKEALLSQITSLVHPKKPAKDVVQAQNTLLVAEMSLENAIVGKETNF